MVVQGPQGERSVKIIDFGVGQVLQKGQRLALQCGTPAYAAPEIVSDAKYSGPAVDVWSLGVVLYLMLVGDYPFSPTPSFPDMIRRIQRAEYPALPGHISPAAAKLIRGMLTADPKKRVSVADILASEWLVRAGDCAHDSDVLQTANSQPSAASVVAEWKQSSMNEAAITQTVAAVSTLVQFRASGDMCAGVPTRRAAEVTAGERPEQRDDLLQAVLPQGNAGSSSNVTRNFVQ